MRKFAVGSLGTCLFLVGFIYQVSTVAALTPEEVNQITGELYARQKFQMFCLCNSVYRPIIQPNFIFDRTPCTAFGYNFTASSSARTQELFALMATADYKQLVVDSPVYKNCFTTYNNMLALITAGLLEYKCSLDYPMECNEAAYQVPYLNISGAFSNVTTVTATTVTTVTKTTVTTVTTVKPSVLVTAKPSVPVTANPSADSFCWSFGDPHVVLFDTSRWECQMEGKDMVMVASAPISVNTSMASVGYSTNTFNNGVVITTRDTTIAFSQKQTPQTAHDQNLLTNSSKTTMTLSGTGLIITDVESDCYVTVRPFPWNTFIMYSIFYVCKQKYIATATGYCVFAAGCAPVYIPALETLRRGATNTTGSLAANFTGRVVTMVEAQEACRTALSGVPDLDASYSSYLYDTCLFDVASADTLELANATRDSVRTMVEILALKTSTPAPPSAVPSSSTSSTGLIVGVVVGCTLLVVVILVILFHRKKSVGPAHANKQVQNPAWVREYSA